MKVKSIKTKEHLVHYMLSSINLSTYDIKFFQNIEQFVHGGKSLTTNQIALLEKLLNKYSKQLTKAGFYKELVDMLPWSTTIIESVPAYTEAHISIEDEKIAFRAPYKKAFVSKFRDTPLNPFVWDKFNRQYEAPFDTYALKVLVEVAYQYYEVVNHCPVTKSLLEDLYEFDSVTIWEPTLVNCNGNLLIAASNEVLDELLRDVELKLDVQTLAILSEYRIKVHPSLTHDDKKLYYASRFVIEADNSELESVIDTLIELQCDMIYFVGAQHGYVMLNNDTVKTKLRDAGIGISQSRRYQKKPESCRYPVYFQFSLPASAAKSHGFLNGLASSAVRKIVMFANSTPVNVK